MVVRHIRMRLRHPLSPLSGSRTGRDIVIVEAHGGGAVGYGEAPVLARPVYNEETVNTAWHVLNDFFAPAVCATGAASSVRCGQASAMFRGHPIAKAGLEGAVWDLWAAACTACR